MRAGWRAGSGILPEAVYAWQSLYNRLMRDDYHFQRFDYELGLWQSVHRLRETWMTSCSDLVVHTLLALLDRAAPAVAAPLMIALSIIGFSWLLRQVTTWLGFSWAGLMPCAALASLVTAAAMASLYSRQSLHWYSAIVDISLPVALMLEMGKRAPSRIWRCFSCLVSLVTGFLIVGIAEIHIIFQFQLGLMSALLLAGIGLTPRESRQRAALLLGAGWLGTLASPAVQLTSSGGPRRAAIFLEYPQFQPVRDPLQLARFALVDTHQLLMQAETLAGFALLFALALAGAGLLLLGLPSLCAIDESAALLLYATALCLFAIAWWEWTAALNEPGQQWLSLLAMAGTAAAGIGRAAFHHVSGLAYQAAQANPGSGALCQRMG